MRHRGLAKSGREHYYLLQFLALAVVNAWLKEFCNDNSGRLGDYLDEN